jgi:hypothetical protein
LAVGLIAHVVLPFGLAGAERARFRRERGRIGREPEFPVLVDDASMVVTTTVTGASSATASAPVCLFNESTGVTAPCRTVSVQIA